MPNLPELKENTDLKDKYFPLNVFPNSHHAHEILYLHWHENIEIILMTEGHGEFYVGNQSIEATPGDILFINSGQLHSGSMLDGDSTEFFAIVFHPSLLSSHSPDPIHAKYIAPFLEGQYAYPSIISKEHSNHAFYKELVLRILHEFEGKNPGYELSVKSHLNIMTVNIFRDYFACENVRNSRGAQDEHMERIKSLILYVEKHYKEKITIGQAAQMVNLSSFHFCKTFKKITGRTFIEFLNMYRVNVAEKLLRETAVPITEIAERTGFCNINYFDRIFKQYKKGSPSECRKTFGFKS